MTKPEETESVQTYGLAKGDRVEFEIDAPQRGRQGRQPGAARSSQGQPGAVRSSQGAQRGRQDRQTMIGMFGFWLHQFRAQQEVREMSS